MHERHQILCKKKFNLIYLFKKGLQRKAITHHISNTLPGIQCFNNSPLFAFHHIYIYLYFFVGFCCFILNFKLVTLFHRKLLHKLYMYIYHHHRRDQLRSYSSFSSQHLIRTHILLNCGFLTKFKRLHLIGVQVCLFFNHCCTLMCKALKHVSLFKFH